MQDFILTEFSIVFPIVYDQIQDHVWLSGLSAFIYVMIVLSCYHNSSGHIFK